MQLRKYFSDIRFWIILAFIIRMIGITNPPLETGHNWRQSTVTMVARNFVEYNPNIFYPRIDIAGEKSGITGMKFPILNYLIYLFSMVFGYTHWYGRLINLVISSIGIYYYYRLIRKYWHERLAFYSTFILIFSIWFTFSRKIMPDTFSMSLIIIGIYYGSNYLDSKGKFKELILFALFTCLGILSKLVSGYILIVFFPLLLMNRISLSRRIIFAISAFFIFVPVAIWYFYWIPELVDKFDFWYFFTGKSFQVGFYEIVSHIPETLKRFYESALMYVGFTLFLIGLFFAIKKKEKKLLVILLLSFLSFLIIIFKSGFTFYHHDYYIIPFVPMMALVAGYCISQINKQWLIVVILFFIGIESVANKFPDFFISKNHSLLSIEKHLDIYTDRSDLIIINSGSYPTPMYFAHRKGWVANNDKILDENYIQDLKSRGLKYIVILKKEFGQNINLNYKKVFESMRYDIYRL